MAPVAHLVMPSFNRPELAGSASGDHVGNTGDDPQVERGSAWEMRDAGSVLAPCSVEVSVASPKFIGRACQLAIPTGGASPRRRLPRAGSG